MKSFCQTRSFVLIVVVICWMISTATGYADSRSERYRPDADAIKNQLFVKKGRHEFSPTLALSTNDAFYQIYYANIAYNYHFADWVSAGILVGMAFTQPTSLTTNYLMKGSNQGGKQGQNGLVPDVRRPFFLSTIALEARFAPVYGKLNFFSEAVVHFDLYFVVGGGLFLTNPPNVTGASDYKGPDGPDSMGFHPFGEIGVGQRYFMLRWMALRWEFNAMLMPESFKYRNKGDPRLRLNMNFHIGLSFLL